MAEEIKVKKKTAIWIVWIDESNKVISIKEIPNARQLYFENKATGLQTLNSLVRKGYKIG
ncbi:MAG TPA: hypothetical protein IAC74_04290 [Candidatus Aphodoplasma excrementigallinarum]|uniref:Uncharacterized protein n=1 Tax=Candidatus Aphodoplasma excrementigallinarum TaxID=2840673 RepID=A0A9D1T0J8_9FIRM|nr:hypothetical protein [Candidatus Aphodoplasma excrementigallinarum]